MKVKHVERSQEIQVQEQEIARKEKELEAKVKRLAEAKKYEMEKIAEANRIKTVLEAEAASEAKVKRGCVTPILGDCVTSVVISLQIMQGDARAYAIEVKGEAEADQMAKKADAWNEYEKAALVDMVLKVS